MTTSLHVNYQQTGASSGNNHLGMRDMQARAFEQRAAPYLLLKAPPASGKSRALMFLALDKLHNQGIRKAIVAVPEMSIGASFRNTKLTEHGFPYDWEVDNRYNLCMPGSNTSKVQAFIDFLSDDSANTLICTHATLRFAYQQLAPHNFKDCLLAIDEFHHSSASEDNRLGELIDGVMNGSNAHIIAMTGSYFRGDAVPILLPEDEERFTQVTYSYYEQLNGYKHLKSLGIGYHFYTQAYINGLKEVLDTDKKTIVHIPNVNSIESTKDKYTEVDDILDIIGKRHWRDPDTGLLIVVRDSDGKHIRVADLVTDDDNRVQVQKTLSQVRSKDDVDIIIALGMAKEGFDWPWCEHVLTIGYRSSLTEIVQIIGRATRDSEGKTHAQFTNLIAQPDAEDTDVHRSVNNMLKAITVSLLMEQVLAPSITFIPRSTLKQGEALPKGAVLLDDTTSPVSPQAAKALQNTDNITAYLLQSPQRVGAAIVNANESSERETLREVEIPKAVEALYPDMDEGERELVSDAIYTKMAIASNGGLFDESDLPTGAQIVDGEGKAVEHTFEPESNNLTGADNSEQDKGKGKDKPKPRETTAGQVNKQFVNIKGKFINIEHLNMDLISEINPFQGAYEVLSKAVTPSVLKTIQQAVAGIRTTMTEEEALILWEHVERFIEERGRHPSLNAIDAHEKRLAECIAFVQRRAQERANEAAGIA